MKHFRCVSLLLVVLVVMLLSWSSVANAATDQEIYDRIQFMHQQIEEITANSVYSNVYVDSSWVDLNGVSTTGTVTQYTYRSGDPTPTINSFTIEPRPFDTALEKVVRYVLGNVANAYRQEPLNTETTMITYQKTTVPIYVYGTYKTQLLDEIILGLPNCFDIVYDTSRGRSDPVTPIPMPIIEKLLSASFSINSTTYTITQDGKTETKTMDVAPEIIGDRTFVPVRFLANSLGVEDRDIKWNGKTRTAAIQKDKISINLAIGNNTSIVSKNGQEAYFNMDVAPYIKNGRTMLPARWVAEPLGAKVEWNEESKEAVISFSIKDSPTPEESA